MTSVNVIASAPPANMFPTLEHYQQLNLPDNQNENFRMAKINKIAASLDQEVKYYKLVAKKYKKAKAVMDYAAAGTGFVSTLFSELILLPTFHWALSLACLAFHLQLVWVIVKNSKGRFPNTMK